MFWAITHYKIPVPLKRRIVFVCSKVFNWLKIAGKTITVIKNNRNAVFAVTWSMDYLAAYADALKVFPALCTAYHDSILLINWCVTKMLFPGKYFIREVYSILLHVNYH